MKVAELFAGVGGFRLGLEKSPYEIIWSNQWEPSTKIQYASMVYEKKFKNGKHSNEDINDVVARNVEEIPDHDTDTPLIVGEIQFGNWALAYRDFFKVLKANVQNSIDCLVYVVPTGNLEAMLSEGIVTYDKSVKILNEFSKVVSVPVWVIGIDLKYTNLK